MQTEPQVVSDGQGRRCDGLDTGFPFSVPYRSHVCSDLTKEPLGDGAIGLVRDETKTLASRARMTRN